MTPQENPTIPYGYCHCGCGEKTEISAKTDTRQFQVRGQPNRFRPYHHPRKHRHSNPLNGKPSGAYQSWGQMKSRCLNPRHHAFSGYGGRGIAICERWLNSFEYFLEDMGERPGGLSLERIDNDGNYEPGNCKWATMLEQGNNRKTNQFLMWNGIRYTQSQLSRMVGISHGAFVKRLRRMTVEEAMSTPINYAKITNRKNIVKG